MTAALITGGAKRIGKAICLKLAELGYDIALHYHNSEKEAAAARIEIEQRGVRCLLFRCDLSNDKETAVFIKNVFDEFPQIDLLVNSASIFIKNSIKDTGRDLLGLTMQINFNAPFLLTGEFGRRCAKGNIINMLDTKIDKNNSHYAAYTLSKKALYELTLMSAKELAPAIRVNGIAPGIILPQEGRDSGYIEDMAKNIPLERKGSIGNITDSVEFILKNDYLTGQVIYCDGGQRL